MTREEAQALITQIREAFRDNTSARQSLLAGMAAGHIERLVGENEDMRAAFLDYVRADNGCSTKPPCLDVERCGCVLEMQTAIAAQGKQ